MIGIIMNLICIKILIILQTLRLNFANNIFNQGPFRNIQLQDITESITTEYGNNNEWDDIITIDMGNNNCFSFAITCNSVSDTYCDLETGAQGFSHSWYFTESLTTSPTRMLVDSTESNTISSCYINSDLVIIIKSQINRSQVIAIAYNTSGVVIWRKSIISNTNKIFSGINCISINGGTEVLFIATRRSSNEVLMQIRQTSDNVLIMANTVIKQSFLGNSQLLKDINGDIFIAWNEESNKQVYAYLKSDYTGFEATQNIVGIPNHINTKFKMKLDQESGYFILLGDDQADPNDIHGQYYLLDPTLTYICQLPQLSINYRIKTPTVEIYDNIVYTLGYNQHSQNFVGNYINFTGATDQNSCNSLSWVENVIDTGKGAVETGHKFTSTLTIAANINMEIFYALNSKPYQMTYTVPPRCLFSCNTCSDKITCDTCKGDRIKNASNLCVCTALSNTYDDGSSINCQTCQIQCAECSGSSDNCSICQGANREDTSVTPKCKCSEKFYQVDLVTADCDSCLYTCQTCENNSECLTCHTGGNRILGANKLCGCVPGYINESVNPLCIQCNYRCDQCTGQKDNCDNCLIGFKRILIAPDCECEYGFYDNGSNLDCVQCNLSCLECISTTCQICQKNRVPITGNLMQCGCPSEDISDLDYFSRGTYSCTTCIFGVYELQFVSLDEINIIFFENITLKEIQDQEVFSILNCKFIFNDFTLFGQNPLCKVVGDKIIVKFSYISQMKLNNIIDQLINPGIIHREGCPQNKYFEGFEQLQPSILKSPDLDTIPQPEIFIIGDLTEGKVFSTLLDIDIKIDQQNILNDGKQDMKLLTYTLKLQSTDEIVFTSLMQQFNGLKSFTIPKLTLTVMTKYKLVVDYQNFLGVSNQKVINFETLDKSDNIYISSPKNPNLQFTIWNYQFLEFDVKFTSYKNGEFVPIKKDFKYSVFQTDQNYQPIKNLLIDELKPDTTSVITYNIQPYTHLNIGTYFMKVVIESLDESANGSSVNFQYNVIPTKPISYIVGGNRIASYSESLDIILKQKDIDIQNNQDQGFINIWKCENLSINDVCKDIQNKEITLDTNGNSQYFDKKIFKPYSVLQFTVDVTKNIHNSIVFAVIVITDTNLPNFTVNLPEQIQFQKINYQNELQINLLYPLAQDSPDLSYNMMFLYKYEMVAIKVFEYSQFSFKIWDYFQDFDHIQPEFVLRVTLYDPNFFMPAETSFNIKVNTPPIGGELVITPVQGISMDTVFKIQVINANDEDLPITYRYYYYNNQDDYIKDTKDGNQSTSINKNLLKDTTSKNLLNSYLVQNIEQNQDLFIMVSIIDGLGGITNVTQSINVQPIQNEQQYLNLQLKYQECQQLDQIQMIDQLNLISVEMDQIYQKKQLSVINNSLYYALKQQLYQQLMDIKKLSLPQNVKDQVLKSINLFIKDQDFQNKQQDTEIQGLLNDFDSILDDIQNNVNFIVNQNLINQGDTEISKRQFQSQSLLGKSLNIFDNIAKKQGKSDSNLQNSINLQKQLERTGQIYHQIVLPNSDPIFLDGEESNIFIQKQTQSKTSQKYFVDSQNPFGLLNEEEQNLNSGFEQGTNSDDKKIYKVQFNGFKKNIFKNDENFEYKDQNNMVQDLLIQDSSNINNTNIELKKPINLYFEPSNIDYDSENQKVEQKCIQKQNDNWKNDSCSVIEDENSTGQVVVKCKCKKLGPTTIASVTSDITNLLKDSNLEEAFSGDGLKKLTEFKFYEAIIFYVYTVSSLIFIILIIKGIHWDKDQRQKQVIAQPLTKVAILKQETQQQQLQQQQQQKEQSNTQNSEINDQNQNINDVFNQNQDIQDIPGKYKKKRKRKIKNNQIDSPLQQQLPLVNSPSNKSTQSLRKKRQMNQKSIFNKFGLEPEPENNNQNISTSKSKEKNNSKDQEGFLDTIGGDKSKQNNANSKSNSNSNINSSSSSSSSSSNSKSKSKSNSIESPKNSNNISSKSNNSTKKSNKISEDKQSVVLNLEEINNYNQTQSLNQNSENQGEVKKQENQNQNLNIKNIYNNLEYSDTARQLIVKSSSTVNKQISNKNIKQNSIQNIIEEEIKQEEKLSDLSQQDQDKDQEKQQKIDIKLLIGMLFFHDFSSIFIVFMDKLPRPVRFVLFYVRILLVMSISALFAGNYSPYQEILINIILSFFVTVPHLILQTLFKCKNRIAKTLVFILCICIFLLSIYMGLVGAAFLGVEKSNQWTINFVTSQLFDVFLIQSLVGVIKTTILIAVLHNKTARAQKIRKALLKEQGQQFLYQQTKLNNISEQQIKQIDLN